MPQGAYKLADVQRATTTGTYSLADVEKPEVHSSFGKTGDFLAGVGAGFANTAVNAYSLLRQIPGADKILPDPAKLQQAIKDATPDSTPSHVGQFVEHAGEFIIPAGKAASLTEGAGLIMRMAAQAGTAGAVRAAQGGNAGQVTDAAAMGAAGPVVGDIAGAVGSKLANIVRTSPTAMKVIPDVVGIVSPRAGNALRVASRVANALKPAAEEAAPEADPLLDGIAQGFKYKDYASAPDDAKLIIERLAKASQEAPVPRAASAPAPQSAAPPIVDEPAPEPQSPPQPAIPARPALTLVPGRPLRAPLQTPEQANITQMHVALDRLRASMGGAPETTAEPKSEMEDLLERSLNDEKVTEQAKAELNDHLKMEALQKTAQIIDKNQTARALKLGRFLQDYGFTPEHIQTMSPEDWAKVGDVAEVTNPSETTIQKTKDLLNMGK